MTEAIEVWEFDKAPEHFRILSKNGGDEDWLVFIPANIAEETLKYGTPHWIDAMDSQRKATRIDLLPGYAVVFIGTHG